MNFDNLEKDKSIKLLVKHLFEKYGTNKFKIKDHWESDQCALGFSDLSEQHLVYVSTIGLEESGYYVALENTTKDDEFPYKQAGEFDKVKLNELEEIFVKHLRI